jgi:hypothetical protein
MQSLSSFQKIFSRILRETTINASHDTIREDYVVSQPSRTQLEMYKRPANYTKSYTNSTGIKEKEALGLGQRAGMGGASSSST